MGSRDALGLHSRYPFLPAARDHVRQLGYTLGDLLTDAAFERARRRGVQRVRSALEAGGIPEAALPSEVDQELELLSYPLARAIVATVGDSYLVNRYAVAESKLLQARLSHEDPQVVWNVVTGLGITLLAPTQGGSFARLHFLDYLRNAPGRDPDWKLVNQPLQSGYVSLPRERIIRLGEEALKERILEDFEALDRPGRLVQQSMERDLNEVSTLVASHRARFAPEATGEVRLDAFPPCMRAIWTGIQKSMNVPHMGRFAIVSFLHTLGMDSEAILKFFATVPDFDVNKSRYQIEHITGKIGGGSEYTPPSCSTMQTYGICPLEARDDICLYQIHHPLSYYRKRLRQLGPPPAAPPAPAVVAEVKDGPPAQPQR